jgi:hypothetical protein
MTSHRLTRPVFIGAALGLLAVACAGEKKPEPLTQRQRDSVIGASKLPGARGVRGAMAVQDSAARRKAVIDSIAKADSR